MGRFGRGDAVEMIDEAGRALGQGLTRYDAGDATLILGRRSSEIEAVLGVDYVDRWRVER